MTVKELIEQLQKYDPKAEVLKRYWCNGDMDSSGYEDTNEVWEARAYPRWKEFDSSEPRNVVIL